MVVRHMDVRHMDVRPSPNEAPKVEPEQPLSPPKKPLWRAPTVILMSMGMTDTGTGAITDGTPHAYHS
jgi:hypothetical protein